MYKQFVMTTLASTALVFCASQAMSTNLVVNSGWQDDTLDAIGQPTENSPWTFTISGSAILSVTDAFIVGDVYTLSGDVSGVTTFYAGAATDKQNSGFYGPNWVSADYSKIALLVGPGSYSFSITGDGAGGIPAGLGVRLDAVPEPASWALMLGGFGAIGGALRSRRRSEVSFG